ncbi:hypothetical protein OFY17_05045 [Marinomonas sp. C2222]|uniref:Outer membrane protein beta-barrel domain-containing protein n=1 Tax=Marinomonas sargassi TaxID=2984494 RepID=A0ABT2YQT3_9GAMM|nr:hypothetical protein [Marinomonas sargassi]MCV2402251.1 hypothetical protein [Marinomonas sargassi]
MSGFHGRYAYISHERFRAIEVHYSTGFVDYQGSGTIENIPDTLLEVRGLFGGKADINPTYDTFVYIGIGYRNLNDDMSGRVSSTSALGYERDQTYIYMPIGLEFQPKQIDRRWGLSGRIEYDLFLSGTNHSYLGEISGYDDITLHQNSGYGYRVSLGLTRHFQNASVSVEPFYRYWYLDDSMVTYDSKNEPRIEPYNNSKELGISFSVTFH